MEEKNPTRFDKTPLMGAILNDQGLLDPLRSLQNLMEKKRQVLERDGIKYIVQLVYRQSDDFKGMPGINADGITNIKEVLATRGYQLKMLPAPKRCYGHKGAIDKPEEQAFIARALELQTQGAGKPKPVGKAREPLISPEERKTLQQEFFQPSNSAEPVSRETYAKLVTEEKKSTRPNLASFRARMTLKRSGLTLP